MIQTRSSAVAVKGTTRLKVKHRIGRGDRMTTKRWLPVERWLVVGGVAAACALGVTVARSNVLALFLALLAAFVCLALFATRLGPTVVLLPALLIPVNAMTSRSVGLIPLGPAISLSVFLGAMCLPGPRNGPLARLGFLALGCMGAGEILAYIAAGSARSPLAELQFLLVWAAGLTVGVVMARKPQAVDILIWVVATLAALAVFELASGPNPWVLVLQASRYTATTAGIVRSTSSFGHPLIAGDIFAVVALLAIGRKGALRWVAGPLLIMGVISTVSRSSAIGLLVGLIAYVVWLPEYRSRVATLVVPLGSLLILAGFLFSPLRQSIEGRVLSSDYQQVTRQATIGRIMTDIENRPQALLLGGGIGSTQIQLTNVGGIGGVDALDNQFATSIYDIGLIPSLASYGLLIAIASIASRRRSTVGPALFCGLVTMAFSDSLYWHSFGVLLWLIVGLAASCENPREAI